MKNHNQKNKNTHNIKIKTTTQEFDILNKKKIEIKKKKKDLTLRTQANIENIKKKSAVKMNEFKKEKLKIFLEELSEITKKFNSVFLISKTKKLEQHSITQGVKLIKKSLCKIIKEYQNII